MDEDPIGAIGESRTRSTGIGRLDLGKPVPDDKLTARIIQHDVEETQSPAQRMAKRSCMQDAMAKQR